jgi:alkylation response protein AidB-like acyl-CoA dehydrogenase
MIDLELSTEQNEILASAADFLARELPLERLNPRPRPKPNTDQTALIKLGELGYLGLGLAEAHGGVGLGAIEETLIFREFGRYLVTPAVLGSVIGARIAAEAGKDEIAQAILSGGARVGLAVACRPGTLAPPFTAEFQLVEAVDADFILFWSDRGAGLIEAGAFAGRHRLESIDSTITLEGARLDEVTPGLWVSADDGDVGLRATLLSSAILVGMAEAARDLAVEYVKVREQFGQPIGAFQSVKHRCSDMAVRASAAWQQTLFAALEMAELGRGTPFQVLAAKIVATDAGYKNGHAGIQNHGGIGFTGEHHPHLFLKRSHFLDQLGGGLKRQQMLMLKAAAPAA